MACSESARLLKELTQSLVNDVHIGVDKKKLLFVLHTLKTHGKGFKPQKIKIEKIQRKNQKQKKLSWCPFSILRKYIQMRPKAKRKTESFFVFRDRSPVQPAHLRSILKNSLKNCGFDSKLYSVHSLRAGQAVSLLKLGVSVETIKIPGMMEDQCCLRIPKVKILPN